MASHQRPFIIIIEIETKTESHHKTHINRKHYYYYYYWLSHSKRHSDTHTTNNKRHSDTHIIVIIIITSASDLQPSKSIMNQSLGKSVSAN